MRRFHLLPKGKKGKKILAIGSISVVSLIVILYFTYPPFKKQVDKLVGIKPKAVEIAPSVEFDFPPKVKPNSSFEVKGRFVDEKGKPVTVRGGYIYVYNGSQMVVQQSLGQNISEFDTTIPTTGFAISDNYSVVVTDTPESSSGRASQIPQAIPTGLGHIPGQPPVTSPGAAGMGPTRIPYSGG